jgi:hypothetical protein
VDRNDLFFQLSAFQYSTTAAGGQHNHSFLLRRAHLSTADRIILSQQNKSCGKKSSNKGQGVDKWCRVDESSGPSICGTAVPPKLVWRC